MELSNYASVKDLQQQKLDIQRQKQSAESHEEREVLDECMFKINERIAGLLNCSSDGFIVGSD